MEDENSKSYKRKYSEVFLNDGIKTIKENILDYDESPTYLEVSCTSLCDDDTKNEIEFTVESGFYQTFLLFFLLINEGLQALVS